MSGRSQKDGPPYNFARLHERLARIERDLQEAAEEVQAGSATEEMSIETMMREKRGAQARLDHLHGELERLEGGRSGRSGAAAGARTASPGELSKHPATKTQPTRTSSRRGQTRSQSAERCRCRCNTLFSCTRSNPNPGEFDRQLHQVQQDLAEAIAQKQCLQERLLELEEAELQTANDQDEIRRELESEATRAEDVNQENVELRDKIQSLELELSNLPVGDCGTMRDASIQITQLLQTLSEDMVKAPELCTKLRMAAQQIIDVEKRCANERGARSMEQQEVQFLRAENQRLREVAFRANMSAFQATVQLPVQAGPCAMPGAFTDPYTQQQGQKKGMFARLFGRKEEEPASPNPLDLGMGSMAMMPPGSRTMMPPGSMTMMAAGSRPMMVAGSRTMMAPGSRAAVSPGLSSAPLAGTMSDMQGTAAGGQEKKSGCCPRK